APGLPRRSPRVQQEPISSWPRPLATKLIVIHTPIFVTQLWPRSPLLHALIHGLRLRERPHADENLRSCPIKPHHIIPTVYDRQAVRDVAVPPAARHH